MRRPCNKGAVASRVFNLPCIRPGSSSPAKTGLQILHSKWYATPSYSPAHRQADCCASSTAFHLTVTGAASCQSSCQGGLCSPPFSRKRRPQETGGARSNRPSRRGATNAAKYSCTPRLGSARAAQATQGWKRPVHEKRTPGSKPIGIARASRVAG